jgi:hypothetical protein
MEDGVLQLWQKFRSKQCPNCNEVIEKAEVSETDEADTKPLYSDKDPPENDLLYCPICVTRFDWEAAPDATAGTEKPPPFVRYDTVCKETEGCEADQIAQREAISPGKVLLGKIRRAGRSLLNSVESMGGIPATPIKGQFVNLLN